MISTVEKRKRPVQVLLVEDNRGDAVLAARAFRKATLATNLVTADSAEQALAMLRKEGDYAASVFPDVILLDLNLPRMHGHEFLNIVKRDALLKHIPVIVLSSSRARQDVVLSYGNYASGYLVKPVDLGRFDDMILALEQFFIKTIALPDTGDLDQTEDGDDQRTTT